VAAPPFVHLHVHSEYSLLRSSATIPRLVKKALELGQIAAYNRVLDFQYETLGIPPAKRVYLEELPPPPAAAPSQEFSQAGPPGLPGM